MVFKTISKTWLETQIVSDHKHHMFIGSMPYEIFPPFNTPINKNKGQPDYVWEAFEGLLKQTINFRSYSDHILSNFH